MSEGPEWFAPKRYGYGAGLPIRWQGWVLLVGFIMLIAGASFVLRYTVVGYISIVAILTAGFIVLAARTTRGGWRWRWGEEE